MKEIEEIIYHQHDVICGQEYGNGLPYSFHLDCVRIQGNKFQHLIKGVCENKDNYKSVDVHYKKIVEIAMICHDSIEDARLTYNDVVKTVNTYLGNYKASEMVADIVYCVTDEKGKNRAERKNEKYYKELSENKLAVFVKLADLSANTIYSKLTGSSMYEKYKLEFPKFKEKVYVEEYEEFFNYVENL